MNGGGDRTVEVTADDGRTYTIPAPPAELALEGARILDSLLYLYSELELLTARLQRFDADMCAARRPYEDGPDVDTVDAICDGWSDLTGNAGSFQVLHALADLAQGATGSLPVQPYQRPTSQELRVSTWANLLVEAAPEAAQ